MKRNFKKMLVFIIIALIIMGLATCASSGDEKSQESTEKVGSQTEGFQVSKQVYDGNYVTLTCNQITIDGIEFEVVNKSEEDIYISLNIGLDGFQGELHTASPDWDIPAGETKVCKTLGILEPAESEHELMSLQGSVSVEQSIVESFEVCDLELGGTSSLYELPDGDEQYSSDDLVVEYLGAEAEGISFKVENKRDKSIVLGVESFKINGEDKDYGPLEYIIVPHSSGIILIDILSSNENYFSKDFKSLEGIMYVHVDGHKADRFPVTFGEKTKKETSKTKKSTKKEKSTEKTTEKVTEETTEEEQQQTGKTGNGGRLPSSGNDSNKKTRDDYTTDHDYEWYMRNGEGGEKFSYTMKVIQTVSDGVYLCSLGTSYSGNMAFIYVNTDSFTKELTGGKRIIEDDTIRVYGEFTGADTYETASGGSKEAIYVKAVFVDIQ